MRAILDSLNYLSKQTRLHPAEQIIMDRLNLFHEVIKEPLEEQAIGEIEGLLIKILSINNGSLSLQCSCFIANCLLNIYSMPKAPKFFSLVTFANENHCNSSLFAAGVIINALGSGSKSLVVGFVDKLIKSRSNSIIPTLFALKSCFKRVPLDLKNYIKPVLRYIYKALEIIDTQTYLLSLTIMKRIYYIDQSYHDEFLKVLGKILKTDIDSFVQDSIHILISIILSFSFKKSQDSKSNNDFEIKNSPNPNINVKEMMNKAFETILLFEDHTHSIFKHFVFMFGDQFIQENYELFIKHIRNEYPEFIGDFVRILSQDVRKALFDKIEPENPPSMDQLHLLKYLQYDEDSSRRVSAIAVQLITSKSFLTRDSATKYFDIISKTNPSLAKEFYLSSCIFIAYPPESHPNLSRHILGMSIIAGQILRSYPNPKELILESEPMLKQFLISNIPSRHVLKGSFASLFVLFPVLPQTFYDMKQVMTSIKHFVHYFANKSQMSDSTIAKAKDTSRIIAQYLYQNPNDKYCSKISELLLLYPQFSTLLSKLFCFLMFPFYPYNDKIINPLMDFVISTNVSRDYSISRFSHPFLFANEIINRPCFHPTPLNRFLFKLSDIMIGYYISESIDKFILHLPIDQRSIEKFLRPKPNVNLLLSLVKNPKTAILFPSDSTDVLIEYISRTGSSLTRCQTASETLAIYVSNSPSLLPGTIDKLKQIDSYNRIIAYISILSHVLMIPESIVLSILHELNDLSTNTVCCAISFHAMSVLIQNNLMIFESVGLVIQQLLVFMQFLHSQLSLDPLNMYYFSECFSSILPIIKLEKNDETFGALLLNVRSITTISLPYVDHMVMNLMRSLFAFIQENASQTILRFPKGSVLHVNSILSACGAFSDQITILKRDSDFLYDFVPKSLFVLQLTDDKRPFDFIVSISKFSKNIKLWVRLAKSCLSTGCLLNSSIKATNMVISCVLSTLKTPLLLLSECEQLDTESLDDIISAIIKGVEMKHKDIAQISYELLYDLLLLFKDKKSIEGDQFILHLYQSQFSIAIRNGFSFLSSSAKFIGGYLDFHVSSRSKDSIIDVYLDGMKKTDMKNPQFFSIAIALSDIARNNEESKEDILNVLSSVAGDFFSIIQQSITLWDSPNPNWSQTSQFRTNYSEIFARLIDSLLWIQNITGKVYITPNDIILFCIRELKRATEKWRVNSAYSSIIASFRYGGKQISSSNKEASITSFSPDNPFAADFCIEYSRNLSINDPSSKLLIPFLSSEAFRPETAARYIYTSHNTIDDDEIIRILKSALKHSSNSFSHFVSLVIFTKPQLGDQIFQLIRDYSDIDISIDASCALLDSNCRIAAQFLADNIQKSYIKVSNSYESGKLVFEQKFPDIFTPDNDNHFMQFLLLSLSKIDFIDEKYDSYLSFVIKISLSIPLFAKSDESIRLSGSLLSLIMKKSPSLIKPFFISSEHCLDINKSFERVYNKYKPKKAVQLKSFSGAPRRQAQQDEWVSLE